MRGYEGGTAVCRAGTARRLVGGQVSEAVVNTTSFQARRGKSMYSTAADSLPGSCVAERARASLGDSDRRNGELWTLDDIS